MAKHKEIYKTHTKKGTRKSRAIKGNSKIQSGKSSLKIYLSDQIKKALEDVRKGMSFYGTAARNGVPRNTLKTKLNNTYKKEKMGPETTSTTKYENDLVIWLTVCAKNVFPVTSEQLRDSVKKTNHSEQDFK